MQPQPWIFITSLLAVLLAGCGDPRFSPTARNDVATPSNPAPTVSEPQTPHTTNTTLEHIRSIRLAERAGFGGFGINASNSSALGLRLADNLSIYLQVHPRGTNIDSLLASLNSSYSTSCPHDDECPTWGPTRVEGTTFIAIQRTASIIGDSCTTYATGVDTIHGFVYDVRLLEPTCTRPVSHAALVEILSELGLVAP